MNPNEPLVVQRDISDRVIVTILNLNGRQVAFLYSPLSQDEKHESSIKEKVCALTETVCKGGIRSNLLKLVGDQRSV